MASLGAGERRHRPDLLPIEAQPRSGHLRPCLLVLVPAPAPLDEMPTRGQQRRRVLQHDGLRRQRPGDDEIMRPEPLRPLLGPGADHPHVHQPRGCGERRDVGALALLGLDRPDLGCGQCGREHEAGHSIDVKENTLSIRGEKRTEQEDTTFLHRGIASRSFERRFQLADHVLVKGAVLENGLLHVDLVRELPEAMKPRTIPIATKTDKVEKPKVIDSQAA